MMQAHAGELLLGCLPVRCEQAAGVGANLHEFEALLDLCVGREHRALRRGEIE
ncbi:Uncharacterised protein [Mycobacterium tuberculosis]|uniref:Uncharacterized protein n=1 Tax=Mycobacterium tuberculosis TaxID=1773 RepID=A0A655JJ47_MYCTX|nr:Uncharacterised protein [Mycobacterium tuberculosis]CKR81922.1 Uncharacterised protein [Mycobacterium tuberculosis]CKR83902.1 Uncharacterised protein [Mycobacterium tuberculosis]CKS56779.1 Uncharacterised protein [Mycobacterium tuberculosis]CKV88100.1 Uncharacterised protein [Mycobacterium tuberculosis]